MHGFLSLMPKPRWQDVLDILIVAYVIYRIALLIRGTRTMQMVFGLGIVAGAFVGSQMLGLFTLNWLLNNFLGSLIVILVVIFQPDIRRALSGVGARSLFSAGPNVASVAQELVSAAAWLAARRIGAVIVKGDQILAAACLLPLSSNPNVSLALGTRHRAAIGMTEDSDAAVIVVSEETGTISLARHGELTRALNPPQLLEALQNLPA